MQTKHNIYDSMLPHLNMADTQTDSNFKIVNIKQQKQESLRIKIGKSVK